MKFLRLGLIVDRRHVLDMRIPPEVAWPISLQEPLDGATGMGATFPLLVWEGEQWFLCVHPRLSVQVAFASPGTSPNIVRDMPSLAMRGQRLEGGWFRIGLQIGDRGRVDVAGSTPWHILFHVLNDHDRPGAVLTTWDSVLGGMDESTG